MTLSMNDLESITTLDDPLTNELLAHVLCVLACDADLSADQCVLLADIGHPLISGALLQNYSAPTAAVELLAERSPELRALAHGHPHAPLEWKFRLLNEQVTGASLDVFFHDVGATKAEKAKVHRRLMKSPQAQFGDTWREVRPRN